MGESSGGKRIAEIQAMLTPMLISSLGWFTWATLAAACYFLWSEEWWYVAIYLVVRFVFVGLLPLPSWKGYVMNRVKKMKPTEFIGLTKQ